MRWRSGLGPRGKEMTFESFKLVDGKQGALTVALRWGPDKEKGLLFYGPTGVGKSHLGCAIVNRLIDVGCFAMVLKTVSIPKESTEEVQKLTDPDEVPVLVLDDLGAEKGTDRALECLYAIVEGRLWNRAPLIVTTNYRPDDLMQRLSESKPGYGERLLSRLKQACEFVPVAGPDMRTG